MRWDDKEKAYFINHLSFTISLTMSSHSSFIFLENMAIGDYLDMKGPKGERWDGRWDGR